MTLFCSKEQRSHPGSGLPRLAFRWHPLPCAVVLALACAAGSTRAADVKPVDKLDLSRYLGSWVEIASIPQFFQRKCVRDTSATYSAADAATIRVENVCTREDGGRERVEGRARVVDADSPAKLEVTFLELFGEYRFWIAGGYWVIALDANYQWAVVGHPSRHYGWVLARERRLSGVALAEVIGRIKLQGYDACEFVVTPQLGGLSVRRPLCEALP